MKTLSRVLIASALLAMLVTPLAIMAGQIPEPAEKKVVAGTTTIDYAGQTFRFTTPVALKVKFEPLSFTQLKLTVSPYAGSVPSSKSTSTVEIFWQDTSSEVYNGPVPDPSWTGVLNSESGFTEK